MGGRITRDLVVRDLRDVRDTVDRLLVAAKRGALDPCDCGHMDIEHGLIRDPESPACATRPCLVAGCECIHFDDAGQQINELRRKQRLAEADVERYRRMIEQEQASWPNGVAA